jgi:hypothetical protein
MMHVSQPALGNGDSLVVDAAVLRPLDAQRNSVGVLP